jgi:uncharacterized repeat protein (TIGR03803 family)
MLGLAASVGPSAQAQTFTVLYSFTGYPTDGAGPFAELLMDASGNLYGTTRFGGSVNAAPCGGSGYIGCGTVFKLDTKRNETVLHNFGGPDGANPSAGLIMDAKSDLYGTTEFGGRMEDCTGNGSAGCGVVFKLSGKKETVLHRFCSVGNCTDGADPWRGLVMDASGALYGTASGGGNLECSCGVVFKIVGKSETVLHDFNSSPDGANPEAGLIIDAKGALYGTTFGGGDVNCDYPDPCGVVFELADKKETILYSFKGSFNPGSRDGAYPAASLFMDESGNLYGTTADGGSSDSRGTVFEVSPGGKEHVLHRFTGQRDDGVRPQSRVIRDAAGNIYGTTLEGDAGDGTVFEISKEGKEKVLHNFCTGDCSDGAYPSDLIMDAKGNLYGTTFAGGVNHNGTIFMITP